MGKILFLLVISVFNAVIISGLLNQLTNLPELDRIVLGTSVGLVLITSTLIVSIVSNMYKDAIDYIKENNL